MTVAGLEENAVRASLDVHSSAPTSTLAGDPDAMKLHEWGTGHPAKLTLARFAVEDWAPVSPL